MNHPFVFIGALLGGLGVAIGAFGAHGLKATLEASGRTETFKTAVLYHLVHALALVLVGVMSASLAQPDGWLTRAGWAFTAGTLVFSGTLYVLSVTGIRWLGAITPLGGLLMIVGWTCLAVSAWRI